MKDIKCQYCGKIFQAKRADARRCKPCHAIRIANHQRSSRGRMLRAKARRALREKMFAGYGGKCQCCGETMFEFLAIDHVNGGGRQDRKIRNTAQIAKDIIQRNFPSDFRVLCHNCNQAIGWYGGCPHNSEWKRTA